MTPAGWFWTGYVSCLAVIGAAILFSCDATGEIYMSVSDAESPREVRFDEKPQTKRVPLEHPWCNVQFTEGYGGYDGPSAVAYDKDYIYITGTYDGSSWIEKFPRDPSKC